MGVDAGLLRADLAEFMYDESELEEEMQHVSNGWTLEMWVETETDMKLGAYAEHISKSSHWGGAVDLLAICLMDEDTGGQLKVIVWRREQGGFQSILTVGIGESPINLLFVGTGHYDALKDLRVVEGGSWEHEAWESGGVEGEGVVEGEGEGEEVMRPIPMLIKVMVGFADSKELSDVYHELIRDVLPKNWQDDKEYTNHSIIPDSCTFPEPPLHATALRLHNPSQHLKSGTLKSTIFFVTIRT